MYLVVIDVMVDGDLVESTAWERPDDEITAAGIFDIQDELRRGYAKSKPNSIIVARLTGIYPVPKGV